MERTWSEEEWRSCFEALGAKDKQVRQDASQTMAKMGESALPWLLKALHDKQSSTRRREAAVTLGLRAHWFREAVPALMEALGDRSAGVCREVLCALGQMREDANAAIPLICGLLRESSSFKIREQAARTLGEIRCQDVVATEVLIHALGEDVHMGVRRAAALSLGFVGMVEMAIPALIRGLQDEEEEVRQQILLSLGTLGVGRASLVPVLMQAFQEPSFALRGAAVTALWKVGVVPESAIDGAFQAIENADHSVRGWAAWALGHAKQPSERVLRALHEGLTDEWWWVRSRSMESLGKLGEAAGGSVQTLVGGLYDDHPLVRLDAALALRKFGASAKLAIPTLLSVADDPHTGVRRAVVQTLERLVGPEDEKSLLAASLQRDVLVQVAAIRALGWAGSTSSEVLARLRKTFSGEHLRVWGALSLVQLGQLLPAEMSLLLESWTETLMRWEERLPSDISSEIEPWDLGVVCLEKQLKALYEKKEAFLEGEPALVSAEKTEDHAMLWWSWQREVGPFVSAVYGRLCDLRVQWEEAIAQSDWEGDAKKYEEKLEETKAITEAMKSLVFVLSHEQMKVYAKDAEAVLF
ncbi:MAG: HEAT repeat domain-containing protein [Myxococcales bacterium]|nr:HEAT repeat domain-containing protein [Myxococcales bacterium]